jgi:hypothetical protein
MATRAAVEPIANPLVALSSNRARRSILDHFLNCLQRTGSIGDTEGELPHPRRFGAQF